MSTTDVHLSPPPISAAQGISPALTQRHAPVEKTRAGVWIVCLLWMSVTVVAGLRLYWCRYTMGPDGVSYIDAADLFRAGHWLRAINCYWGPLYSLAIAGVFRVVHPTRAHEVAAAHLANLAIFILGAMAFLFFWKGFLDEIAEKNALTRSTRNSAWWHAIGFALYTYSAFNVYTLPTMSPDLLVQACFTTAAGILLRLPRLRSKYAGMIGLGVVLGLGYLAKAIVLPFAFVFLALTFWRTGRTRQSETQLIVALVVFTVVVAPYIYAMSQHKGQLSLGDTGRLNYAWFISWNHMPQEMWDGEPSGTGVPVHAPRKIHSSPDIFEFASPIEGTYPPWFDPAYWNEGLTAPLHLGRQVRAIAINLATVVKVTLLDDRELTLCFLFLVLCVGRKAKSSVHPAEICWPLVLLAAVGFGVYCLVHIEQRFFGAFDLFLWAALLGYAAPCFAEDRRLFRAMGISLLVAVLAANGLIIRQEYSHRNDKDLNLETAEALVGNGVKPGERVAVIGSGMEAAWAQIAGVRITVSVPTSKPGLSSSPEAMFWASDKTLSESLEAIRATGVAAVVTQQPPPVERQEWKRLGSTNKYLLTF